MGHRDYLSLSKAARRLASCKTVPLFTAPVSLLFCSTYIAVLFVTLPR
jgi:hypothetical protein